MARTLTAPEALISPMESGNQDKCGHGNTNSNSHTTVVASTSHGSISVIGRRRVMEDAVKIIPAFMGDYDFFAVYDGHGGAAVANACQERLHMLVAEEVAVAERGLDWHKVMCSCFVRMDHEIDNNNAASASASSGELFQHSMVGSTALVLMVGRQELVVANCGDSRAVLCRGGVALPLSRDREPDRPDEGEKVETAGGRVISWNANRVLGVVATSRSIGDHCLKPFVIPEPEVNVYERAEGDEFIVVASDGLWDVISNNLACEVVRRCLDGQMRRIFKEGFIRSTCAAEAAALLAELAMVRGSKDNISVIVVQLKPSI